MTKVAITTVNFNRQDDTFDFLRSLQKLDTQGLQTKTFVVSNERLEAGNPPFTLLYHPQNRGSAGGYNDGAKAALQWGADYLLMCNNDILLKDKNLLPELISTIEKSDNIAVVVPKMYFAPGFEFYKGRYSSKNRGHVLWYAGGSFDWGNVFSSHRGIDQVDTGKYDIVEETDFINITCILVKSKIFKKGLFFDENLFAYFDDADWSERLGRAGYKKYYDGRVAIYHKVSRTSGIASPISDYYITRNRLIFAMRYAPLRSKLALLRQASRLLFSGRPAQKQAVLDFLLGRAGELRQHHLV